MNKELEALEFICKILKEKGIDIKWLFKEQYNTIKQALQRLEAIDNSNPSDAIECVDDINADLVSLPKHIEGSDDTFDDYLENISLKISIIKRTLLKYQEKEKDKVFLKSLHNTKVKVPLCDIFNGLPREKRFAYTEHIYYHWEEMKESLEEEIKTLKDEKETLESKTKKQEKVLKIIFEKRVDMWHLADLLEQNYEMYLAFCESEGYAKEYILTEDEFELVKKVSCGTGNTEGVR